MIKPDYAGFLYILVNDPCCDPAILVLLPNFDSGTVNKSVSHPPLVNHGSHVVAELSVATSAPIVVVINKLRADPDVKPCNRCKYLA